MISDPPDIFEGMSFFEALAYVIDQSGLTQPEIARNANKHLEKTYERMMSEAKDSTERILIKLAKPKLLLYPTTINRAVRAVSSIGPETLERIALGLALDQEILEKLEEKRQAEENVHHSKTQPVVSPGKNPILPSSWLD